MANTAAPDPVSSVNAEIKLALDGVARNVATLAANPETPEDIGNPVQFVSVPDVGVPNKGVVRVGDVPNTNDPVPVSSVKAVIKLALEGVAKKVATLAANPVTPVEIGNPVQLVRVPLVGVPKIGVTKVGVLAKTAEPVPVSSVRVAAKLALEGVAKNVATPVPSPEIPVDTGNPIQFVRVPLVGIPRMGVINVGDVRVGAEAKTKEPVPVPATENNPVVPEIRSPTK